MLLLDHLLKLVLASFIGFLVGLERSSRRGSQIGVGTTSNLITGVCLLTIISANCLPGSDPSRLIANIITAIGFLCGGVIFTKPTDDDTNDQEVVGLTTGATLFSLAGVGIAIGLGYYWLAISTTIIVELNILASRLIKKVRQKGE
ncbi:MgtC/SapB family protein [Romboutsia sp.]|uniref:MgtC/SapB family protein n=1 Tax=Romboutsia sp. TaxID=1965302 RepID=UPI002C31AEF9|nr:MgtC/SapB family protein [Romboutsia sp.]HSQ89992.1 MgtC/SapB family protein [Romboutsia sp.]